MAKLVIRKEDLAFEAFRAGGKGGQHQNKTSSAIRCRHLPTGITAECRNERCQFQNKKMALALVIEKIRAVMLGDQDAKRQESYRQKADAAFASQRRSYVLCGNAQRVTDHRTGVESANPQSVLRGGLDDFLRADMVMSMEFRRSTS